MLASLRLHPQVSASLWLPGCQCRSPFPAEARSRDFAGSVQPERHRDKDREWTPRHRARPREPPGGGQGSPTTDVLWERSDPVARLFWGPPSSTSTPVPCPGISVFVLTNLSQLLLCQPLFNPLLSLLFRLLRQDSDGSTRSLPTDSFAADPPQVTP